VLGYLVFGFMVVMLLNRDYFSFLPRWYRRSRRTTADGWRLAAWYPTILLLWPALVPVFIACRLYDAATHRRSQMRRRASTRSTASRSVRAHSTVEPLAKPDPVHRNQTRVEIVDVERGEGIVAETVEKSRQTVGTESI